MDGMACRSRCLRAPLLSAALALGCESTPLDGEPGDADPRDDSRGLATEVSVFDAVRISSDESAEHFQSATTTLDFGLAPLARATLRVELESPCFPFDKWTQSSIPEGHLWPEACDAFDRTFQFSIDDRENADNGLPGLEFARAITPFGGPLGLEFELTDLANGLPGTHTLKIEIPTYPDPAGQVSGAKGEWIVSARLELVPGTPPRRVLAVVPLAYTAEAAAAGEPLQFETPAGTGRALIEYRVTGHGGGPRGRNCLGPSEEFCQREHRLYLDDQLLDAFEPWRNDCSALCTPAHYESELFEIDYCAENPCGAVSSVRASRANWCPGSLTPPRLVENEALAAPGFHQFNWTIDEIGEGGSWLLSAVYYAYE
jgi:hypothetical protein